jgi:hypothetical protein
MSTRWNFTAEPPTFQTIMTAPVYTVIGKIVTIQELMEEQRRRVRSRDPAERFAAALLLPAELAKRLRTVSSFHLGELLEHEVCSNLNLLAPELPVCAEAAERLRQKGSSRRLATGFFSGTELSHEAGPLSKGFGHC